MACDPNQQITQEDLTLFKQNIEAENQHVNSSADTFQKPGGGTGITQTGIENAAAQQRDEIQQLANQAISAVDGVDIGVWTSGVTTYNNYNEYATFDRSGTIERWYLRPSIPLGYTATTTDPINETNFVYPAGLVTEQGVINEVRAGDSQLAGGPIWPLSSQENAQIGDILAGGESRIRILGELFLLSPKPQNPSTIVSIGANDVTFDTGVSKIFTLSISTTLSIEDAIMSEITSGSIETYSEFNGEKVGYCKWVISSGTGVPSTIDIPNGCIYDSTGQKFSHSRSTVIPEQFNVLPDSEYTIGATDVLTVTGTDHGQNFEDMVSYCIASGKRIEFGISKYLYGYYMTKPFSNYQSSGGGVSAISVYSSENVYFLRDTGGPVVDIGGSITKTSSFYGIFFGAAQSDPSSVFKIANDDIQLSNSKATMHTCRNGYNGFDLQDYTGDPLGTIFLLQLGSIRAVNYHNRPLSFDSKTGSTTLQIETFYGLAKSTGNRLGPFINNVNDITIENIAIDNAISEHINFVNFNQVSIRQLAMESCEFSGSNNIILNGSVSSIVGLKNLGATIASGASVVSYGANSRDNTISGYNEQNVTGSGYNILKIGNGDTDVYITDGSVTPDLVDNGGFFANFVFSGDRVTSTNIPPNYARTRGWKVGQRIFRGSPASGQPQGVVNTGTVLAPIWTNMPSLA